MPCRSDTDQSTSLIEKASGTQSQEFSVDLDHGCGCCCGSGCRGSCGCHGRVISALFLAEGVVSGGLSASAGPARPTNINYSTQGGAMDTRDAVGNHMSPVDNSFEATQPAQLTQANLKYHNSLSPAATGILKHHFDHNHSAKDLTNDDLVEEPVPCRSDTDHDDGSFIPGVVDEQPLQELNATGHGPFGDHRSSLSDWDRSFNRFSPGTSAILRGVGANVQPHYFTYGPLPLLEHRDRPPILDAQCVCYG